MEKRKNCNPKPKNQEHSRKQKQNPVHKKARSPKPKKLSAAEFADMNQVDWVPFDPYGD